MQNSNLQTSANEGRLALQDANSFLRAPNETSKDELLETPSTTPKFTAKKLDRKLSLGAFDAPKNLDNTEVSLSCSVTGPCGLYYFIRRLVSGDKKRLKECGYNLDLTYVTPRIIALGYPAEETLLERVTRNHIDEVHSFFVKRHRGKIKMYNLVGERDKCRYDMERFRAAGVQVSHDFGFMDHSVPTLELLEGIATDMSAWLVADRDNIVAVHCKAGKGRTGVVVCAFLLHYYSDKFATTASAIDYYGDQRMINGKGLTVPSQRRFVDYFHRRATPLRTKGVLLRSLSLCNGRNAPAYPAYRVVIRALRGGTRPGEEISTEELFSSKQAGDYRPGKDGQVQACWEGGGLALEGIFCIQLYLGSGGCGGGPRWRRGPSCWFHSSFVTTGANSIPVEEWDFDHCQVRKRSFRPGWAVEALLEESGQV